MSAPITLHSTVHNGSDRQWLPPETSTLRSIGARALPTLDLSRAIEEIFDPLTAAYGVLDSISYGIVLIDSSTRVCYANDEAHRIGKCADAITIKEGRLQLLQESAQQRLANYLDRDIEHHKYRETVTDSRFVTALPRKGGERAYALIVKPLAAQRRLYGCFIHDTDRHRSVAVDVLRDIYGLTSAEVEVATLLFQGNNVEQAARLLAIRASTIRAHLTKILAKCEVRSLTLLLQQLALGPRA